MLVVVALLSLLYGSTPANAHTDTNGSQFYKSEASNRGLTYGDPNLRQDEGSSYLHFDEIVLGSWPNTNPQPEHWRYERRRLTADGTRCPDGAGGSNWTEGNWTQLNAYSDYHPVHNAALIGPGFAACPKVEVRVIGLSGTVYMRAKTTSAGEGPAAPTGFGVVSTSPGGKVLTYDQVAALALRSGWGGLDLVTAVAVARAESSFRTKAVSYTGCCHGLWQVNSSVHGTTAETMFDPLSNGLKAFTIWDAANSWSPWEAYTLGMHSQFMDEAEAAVSRQVDNGGQAYHSIAQAPSSDTGTVTLGWSTTCAACTYTLQRSSAATGPWASIGTTTGLTYADRNASSGTTYYYRVKGTASGQDSPWSSVVGVTTGAADPGGEINEQYQGEQGLGGVGAIDPDAGVDDEGNGVSCSWFNIFCHMKAFAVWAFKPGAGTFDAWAEFRGNLENKPPFSIIYGAGEFITDTLVQFNSDWELVEGMNESQQMCFTITVRDSFTTEKDTSACFGQAFVLLSTAEWVPTARMVMTIAILWGASLLLWRILRSAFSDAADVNAGDLNGPGIGDE